MKTVKSNPIEIHSDHAVLYTVDRLGNKKTGYIIDLDDVEKVHKYKWSDITAGKAYCYRYKLFLHRLIARVKPNQQLRFIDGNKYNVRKSNLTQYSHSLEMRISNKTTNKLNCRHIRKAGKCYIVILQHKGITYYIGGSTTLEEAIEKRNSLYDKIKYFEE